MDPNKTIYIKGARVNNLKNIDVEIPRDQLVVVTGLSGSGKSSLAFDTLYAEGQRRYVESLSSYARQFLGRKGKPECDYILGIPPAVAIEQKVVVRNPRSTVGTSTEIYDYLRLLFARIGRTYSPISGEWVKKHTTEDVVSYAQSLPTGTRVALMVNITLPEGRTLAQHVEVLMKSGFSRAEVGGKFIRLDEVKSAPLHMVVDRMSLPFKDAAAQSRFADSVETAFYEGNNEFLMGVWLPAEVTTPDCETPGGHYQRTFSKRFEADGMTFEEPTEMMFNFNNPMGACPTCEGFGRVLGIDEDLVIPNKALSVYEDCVVCWKGEKMSEWKNHLIANASKVGFPIHRPYYQLTEEQKGLLWHGCDAFYGIDDFFRMVSENLYKIQYRVMQARYRGKTICPTCHGTRLKQETTYVKIGGCNITDLVHRSVDDLIAWFDALTLDETDATVARRLLTEIRSRLGFLHDVGLGYLTLDRMSNTLSGGESQRINLATSLGSALVGSMYILDEPSIGLHSRDTELLIHVLRKLRDLGNTVVVVEHDEEIIRAADYLIDIGPEAGCNGGEVVFSGKSSDIGQADATRSHTVRFLRGQEVVELPLRPRPWASYIEVKGAVQNNLKDIDVKFPLGVMTVVTGVSGSGKSTLVRDLLYRGLMRHLGEACDAPGAFSGLGGDLHRIRRVEMVDQNPIGKSTRSNAATYMKAYDEIRRLFADQPYAKQMGFTPATFSFNVEGGRCEVCKGEGTVTVEMQFMADLVIECEECHGRRFNNDVLEVRYKGKNITDVLDLSVDEAITFFAEDQRIVSRLLPLQQVGLGYIKLGQSSSTLSGGENQRVKLAYYLAFDDQIPTLFIFDEPTTGLHIHDVRVLLHAFNALIDKGQTLVVIEHNLDVIKCADHIIDLGPEGGAAGGHLVVQGTPQEVAACPESYTGRYLKEKLTSPHTQPTTA
jgi:excinuclease ABC subunit A